MEHGNAGKLQTARRRKAPPSPNVAALEAIVVIVHSTDLTLRETRDCFNLSRTLDIIMYHFNISFLKPPSPLGRVKLKLDVGCRVNVEAFSPFKLT